MLLDLKMVYNVGRTIPQSHKIGLSRISVEFTSKRSNSFLCFVLSISGFQDFSVLDLLKISSLLVFR